MAVRCRRTEVEVGLRPMAVAVGPPAALVGERGMFLPHLVMAAEAAVDTPVVEAMVGTAKSR